MFSASTYIRHTVTHMYVHKDTHVQMFLSYSHENVNVNSRRQPPRNFKDKIQSPTYISLFIAAYHYHCTQEMTN